jgi:hypothetical protein
MVPSQKKKRVLGSIVAQNTEPGEKLVSRAFCSLMKIYHNKKEKEEILQL